MSQTRKISTILLTAAFLAMSVVVISPQAAAQATPQLTIEDVVTPNKLLVPEVDNEALVVKYKYSLPNAAATLPTAATTQVQVDFMFNCPSFVIITGPASVLLSISPGQDTAFSDDATFRVSVKRTAPGLEQLRCTVQATAAELNQQQGSVSSAAFPFSVSADYYGLLQGKVNTQLKRSGPDKQVPFEIEVTNFGNARTQVNFEILERPSGGKWQALVPAPILLESPNTGLTPTQDTAIFEVSTTYRNGWNNLQGAFQVKVAGKAADVPDKPGTELTTNFVVRVRGVYVPTLEPMIMVGAVLSMAFVARMRRDEE